MLNDKLAVARVLREIARLLQMRDENAFKVRAYEIAADRIAGLPQDLADVVRSGGLQKLQGIGPALAEKITELVNTGALRYHQELKAAYPPGVFELLKVPELGPKKVAALWEALQIQDVRDLEVACREGRVRTVRGFTEKSEHKLLEGIELLRRTVERRLLGAVLPPAEALLAQVRAVPGVRRAELAGSARRFCETVGDLDLVACASDAPAVLEAFARSDQVAAVLGRGETKCSVRLFRDDLQVDLRVLPEEDFATALHHFTGSKAHHIRLRGLAQERGLKISEYGVFRGEQKLAVDSEAALYALLGMQDVPPELREDWGEIERALEDQLPADLLTPQDIQGAVHSHSTWSDGKSSLEDMARAAAALGLKYLTVTEHSQTAHYAGGLKLEDLRRQWLEIDRINATVPGIRLLKGIETDILEDGRLDYPDEVLAQLDVVIGSIHERHQLDEAGMTRRVLRAFDNPHLHIYGHATGRLIQTRPPFGLDMDAVLTKAAQKGIAVEVNGNPHRLDLKAEHVRMALDRGVKLVASVDAHSVHELSYIRFAVGTARKGWARRGDVLNTLPAEGFLDALRG